MWGCSKLRQISISRRKKSLAAAVHSVDTLMATKKDEELGEALDASASTEDATEDVAEDAATVSSSSDFDADASPAIVAAVDVVTVVVTVFIVFVVAVAAAAVAPSAVAASTAVVDSVFSSFSFPESEDSRSAKFFFVDAVWAKKRPISSDKGTFLEANRNCPNQMVETFPAQRTESRL